MALIQKPMAKALPAMPGKPLSINGGGPKPMPGKIGPNVDPVLPGKPLSFAGGPQPMPGKVGTNVDPVRPIPGGKFVSPVLQNSNVKPTVPAVAGFGGGPAMPRMAGASSAPIGGAASGTPQGMTYKKGGSAGGKNYTNSNGKINLGSNRVSTAQKNSKAKDW